MITLEGAFHLIVKRGMVPYVITTDPKNTKATIHWKMYFNSEKVHCLTYASDCEEVERVYGLFKEYWWKHSIDHQRDPIELLKP